MSFDGEKGKCLFLRDRGIAGGIFFVEGISGGLMCRTDPLSSIKGNEG